MRAHVPLAAEVAHGQDQDQDQDQDRHPERSLVSPSPVTSLGEPAWEAFYALVYVASAILVESAPRSTASGIAAGLAFIAMIPWYLLLGRPVMLLDEPAWQRAVAGWRGPVYLTGIIALFAVADHANPNAWFLAFALSPQCFQLTVPFRRAMVFVIALNLVGGLTIVLASPTAQNVATAAGTVLFAIAFSVVFSRWVVRVIEQSHERAALIAQLESAQAELAAAYHETGVHAERQRLAAEIHDTLAQGFTSIVTLLQAAQSARTGAASGLAGRGAPDLVGEYLELALATARENLAEARTLVAALAPGSLDDGGLVGAVARATGATGKAAGIEATCAAEGDGRTLPTAAEVVLLRVCQEALANVRKHAAATRVDVRLRYTPGTVELAVADNGCGFTTTREGTEEPAGFGLRGMRVRLRQVGGTLTVATAPGAGTTVRAEIPA
jgi:signal transduction histidine kinase